LFKVARNQVTNFHNMSLRDHCVMVKVRGTVTYVEKAKETEIQFDMETVHFWK